MPVVPLSFAAGDKPKVSEAIRSPADINVVVNVNVGGRTSVVVVAVTVVPAESPRAERA